jgi:hypothetical protein
MHASPLRNPTTTPVQDRHVRPALVLTAAAVLALVLVTPATGDEADPTDAGSTQLTANGEHVDPCVEGRPEVLAGTLGAGTTARGGDAPLLLPADDTPDAVFPCLHPRLNCAL